MANCLSEQQRDLVRTKVLCTAALLFVEKGYSATTTRELAARSGIQVSAMNRAFGSKEHILSELMRYVMEDHFSVTQKVLAGKTTDPVLHYALEAALQLYMSEHSEAIRDLYCNAYSLSETREVVLRAVTANVIAPTFAQYLPDYTPDDFYQLEIASGSIMKGYMSVKCDTNFTVGQKAARFLEAALRIYRVPPEQIREAAEFVNQFDLEAIARDAIGDMMNFLR